MRALTAVTSSRSNTRHPSVSPVSPCPPLPCRMPDVAEAEAAWLARLAASLSQNAARVLPCARRAAVACLLRQSPGGLECFFIIRAAHPGDPWSGDVAWPGGRVEAGETDLQAAIRETREEVGLHLDESCYQLLGPLDDRPAVRKKGRATLVVRTFIFVQRAPETAPLQLQPKEVAAAWWVPLSLLTSCPQPLPLFRVPVTRLSTRFPALVRHYCMPSIAIVLSPLTNHHSADAAQSQAVFSAPSCRPGCGPLPMHPPAAASPGGWSRAALGRHPGPVRAPGGCVRRGGRHAGGAALANAARALGPAAQAVRLDVTVTPPCSHLSQMYGLHSGSRPQAPHTKNHHPTSTVSSPGPQPWAPPPRGPPPPWAGPPPQAPRAPAWGWPEWAWPAGPGPLPSWCSRQP